MNQHVRPPDPILRPSDPAAPEYQWERFAAVAHELPPLFRRHWEEIALNKDSVPLEPDWHRYCHLELAGALHILTVRSRGALVGYCFMLVNPGLHYASTILAQTDIFWLDPLYRTAWTGVRMFKEVEKGMRQLGVQVMYVSIKLHFQASRGTLEKLFRRLGFTPVDLVLSKKLR